MNVDIGAKAALFPEKEHISGIFVAVHLRAIMKIIFFIRFMYKT
jgi:hypothetical protein